jgi:hypothetical protein
MTSPMALDPVEILVLVVLKVFTVLNQISWIGSSEKFLTSAPFQIFSR